MKRPYGNISQVFNWTRRTTCLTPSAKSNWRPSRAERRKFGWSLVIGFPSLAAALLLAARLWSGAWHVTPFLWLGGCGLAAGALFVAIPFLAVPFLPSVVLPGLLHRHGCRQYAAGGVLLLDHHAGRRRDAGARAAGGLQDVRQETSGVTGTDIENADDVQGLLPAILSEMGTLPYCAGSSPHNVTASLRNRVTSPLFAPFDLSPRHLLSS